MGNSNNNKKILKDLIYEVQTNDNSLSQFYIINNFYNSIKSSLAHNTDLSVKNLAKQFSSFCLSEKLFIYLVGKDDEEIPLFDFMVILEQKEKYLSLKIFFLFIGRN